VLGVVVSVCLCCVSRTRARVGREARACAARTAVKKLCAAPCVRVCVVCFATRAGAVGATLAPRLTMKLKVLRVSLLLILQICLQLSASKVLEFSFFS